MTNKRDDHGQQQYCLQTGEFKPWMAGLKGLKCDRKTWQLLFDRHLQSGLLSRGFKELMPVPWPYHLLPQQKRLQETRKWTNHSNVSFFSLTCSQSILRKKVCDLISVKPVWTWQPSRSLGSCWDGDSRSETSTQSTAFSRQCEIFFFAMWTIQVDCTSSARW